MRISGLLSVLLITAGGMVLSDSVFAEKDPYGQQILTAPTGGFRFNKVANNVENTKESARFNDRLQVKSSVPEYMEFAGKAESEDIPEVTLPPEEDMKKADIANADVVVDDAGKAVLYINHPVVIRNENGDVTGYTDPANQMKVALEGVDPADIESVELEVSDDGKISARVILKDGTEKLFDVEKPEKKESESLAPAIFDSRPIYFNRNRENNVEPNGPEHAPIIFPGGGQGGGQGGGGGGNGTIDGPCSNCEGPSAPDTSPNDGPVSTGPEIVPA